MQVDKPYKSGNVLVMFSFYGNAYQGMAFSADKNRHARRACARATEDVLTAYLQGQEKSYAVRMIMQELHALFHAGAVLPCRLIEDALQTEDEDLKAGSIARALHMLEKQVLGDSVTKAD